MYKSLFLEPKFANFVDQENRNGGVSQVRELSTRTAELLIPRNSAGVCELRPGTPVRELE